MQTILSSYVFLHKKRAGVDILSIMAGADLPCRRAGRVVRYGTASSSALRVSTDWPGGCTDWLGVCRDAGQEWRLRGMCECSVRDVFQKDAR